MTKLLNRNPRYVRFIICLVLAVYTCGCTTMRPIRTPDGSAYPAQIEAGDTVRVTRNDQSTAEFEVSEISDDGIGGDGTFVAWSDVQQVEIKKFNALLTATAIILGAAVFVLVGTAGSSPYGGRFFP